MDRFAPLGAVARAGKAAAAKLGPRAGDLRQAIRVAIGCVLAFALYHLFDLPQGYWAVFTVVIVMQGSLGGTLSAAFDRMRGTLLGAVVGAVAATLRPQTPVGLGGALAASVLITTFVAAARPRYKVAPVTAVIMLISPTGGHIGPLESAAFRVVEIFIGSVIGVATSLLVFPARSNRLVIDRVGAALEGLAALCDRYAEDLRSDAPVPDRRSEHVAIRATIGGVESAMADAVHERSTRLEAKAVSEAVPRTLWRVRNDLVAAGRGMTALSPAARPMLAAAAAALLGEEAAMMRRCARALSTALSVDRTGQAEALRRFDDALQGLRASRRTHDLQFDEAGPVFALAFALESLHRNLGDFADRVDEMADGVAAA